MEICYDPYFSTVSWRSEVGKLLACQKSNTGSCSQYGVRHEEAAFTTLGAIALTYGLVSGYLNIAGSLLTRYTARIEATQKERLARLTALNERRQLRAELMQLQETVDSCHHRMTLDGRDHLIRILNAARGAGLTLGSCGPVRETPQEWRTKKTIQTSARGTLAQIIQFFVTLQSGDAPMKCHTMSLTHSSDNLFVMSCSLATFSLDVKNPST